MTASADLDRDAVALRLGSIAVEAGRGLAAITDRHLGHEIKPDGSPCSAADRNSERLIAARLREAWPDMRRVGAGHGAEAHPEGLFFLVDPLDGTRDYLSGAGEYSVNIALVDGTRPIASSVAAPSCGRVWVAGTHALEADVPEGGSEFAWKPARVRAQPADGMVALVSRRHGDPVEEALLATLPIRERRTASSAFKFCLIASGEADLYIRGGPTMEWDTAAGDHLVAMAGGVTIGPDQRVMTYGHTGRRYLNGAFAAMGDPALAPRITLPQP